MDQFEHQVGELSRALTHGDVVTDRDVIETYRQDRCDLVEAGVPACVARPRDLASVSAIMEWATRHGIPVVPRGSGTGLSGGATAITGGIVLSLERMTRIGEVNTQERTVVVGPGAITADIDRKARQHGLFYAPDPGSFEMSTIGGNLATNAGGMRCVKYGVTRNSVLSLELVLADGRVANTGSTTVKDVAGLDLTSLFVGSEGTLGIITEVTLRIRRVPKAVQADSWFFPDFASGTAALREMEQSGLHLDIARLSDVNETEFGLAQLGSELQRKGVLAYLRARGITTPCLLVVRYDGAQPDVRSRRSQGRSIVRRHKGVNLGAVPETSWEKHRFSTPYLRDQLLREGMIVETLETSAPWSKVEDLHDSIRAGIEKEMADRGTPAFVLCHVSHLYAAGCSLYYTVFAKQQVGAEIAQWKALKSAASDAIMTGGGTITHHHAVGTDHAPWLPEETGKLWLRMLRAAKAEVDPTGIMNPGKLMNGPDRL